MTVVCRGIVASGYIRIERRLRAGRRVYVTVVRYTKLDQACPREHIDIHVARSQQVLALALREELLLATQVGSRSNQWINEFDLNEG